MYFGCPDLIDSGTDTGSDWLLRPTCDWIAPVHDVGVNYVLPLLQYPDPIGSCYGSLPCRCLKRTSPEGCAPSCGNTRG